MTPTVGDVMREVRNYFQHTSTQRVWSIIRGRLTPDAGFLPGTWIAVCGSVHNDGVYQLDENLQLPGCTDETFEGVVWQLAPSAEFLALCRSIAAWCSEQPADTVKRESFGGYSMERFSGPGGSPVTWQQRFAARLTPFRRMYPGVKFG